MEKQLTEEEKDALYAKAMLLVDKAIKLLRQAGEDEPELVIMETIG